MERLVQKGVAVVAAATVSGFAWLGVSALEDRPSDPAATVDVEGCVASLDQLIGPEGHLKIVATLPVGCPPEYFPTTPVTVRDADGNLTDAAVPRFIVRRGEFKKRYDYKQELIRMNNMAIEGEQTRNGLLVFIGVLAVGSIGRKAIGWRTRRKVAKSKGHAQPDSQPVVSGLPESTSLIQ